MWVGLVAAATGSVAATGVRANDEAMTVVQNTYRNAVVKIVVSSASPVYRNNTNICRSEGTGFFVSRDRVMTAAHVYQIDPACGEPVILVRSTKHKVELLGKKVVQKDDVAVLSVTGELKQGLCSLKIAAKPEFASPGYRFGIPDGLEDPDPVPLNIGEYQNQFNPLVRLRPVATHRGDSGGPVLKLFRVVGITKARHEVYTDLSLMISSDKVNEVLSLAGIKDDGSACNAADYQIVSSSTQSIFPPGPAGSVGAFPPIPTGYSRRTVVAVPPPPSIGGPPGLVEISSYANTVKSQAVQEVSGRLASSGSGIDLKWQGFTVTIDERKSQPVFVPIPSLFQDLSDTVERRLWNDFMAALMLKQAQRCATTPNTPECRPQ